MSPSATASGEKAVHTAASPGAPVAPVRPWRSRLIGLVSELLLLVGALTGLFVAWQSWWTDVAAAPAQQQLLAQLHQASPSRDNLAGRENRGPAPVVPEPRQLATVFGSMQIPRFGADYRQPIGQGTDRLAVLNVVGLGHYDGTAMPGGVGNFAVAGHRVTYGKPLNQIATLRPGDPIVVRVTDQAAHFDVWYVYKVTTSEIVLPTQTQVIAPVPDRPGVQPTVSDRWLTLTACNPMWSARERYITHAQLDYWMPASEGTPDELTSGADR